ncbi:MAG: hypothetical protein ACOZCL_04480 [Bacillota bacterium]
MLRLISKVIIITVVLCNIAAAVSIGFADTVIDVLQQPCMVRGIVTNRDGTAILSEYSQALRVVLSEPYNMNAQTVQIEIDRSGCFEFRADDLPEGEYLIFVKVISSCPYYASDYQTITLANNTTVETALSISQAQLTLTGCFLRPDGYPVIPGLNGRLNYRSGFMDKAIDDTEIISYGTGGYPVNEDGSYCSLFDTTASVPGVYAFWGGCREYEGYGNPFPVDINITSDKQIIHADLQLTTPLIMGKITAADNPEYDFARLWRPEDISEMVHITASLAEEIDGKLVEIPHTKIIVGKDASYGIGNVYSGDYYLLIDIWSNQEGVPDYPYLDPAPIKVHLEEGKLLVRDIQLQSILTVNPVSKHSEIISGKAMPGQRITIYSEDKLLADTKVSETGDFYAYIPKLKKDDKLEIALNINGVQISSKTIHVENTKLLKAPTVKPLAEGSKYIEGKACENLPVLAFILKEKDGLTILHSIGEAKADKDGCYKLAVMPDIKPGEAFKGLKSGTEVVVLSIDDSGMAGKTKIISVK